MKIPPYRDRLPYQKAYLVLRTMVRLTVLYSCYLINSCLAQDSDPDDRSKAARLDSSCQPKSFKQDKVAWKENDKEVIENLTCGICQVRIICAVNHLWFLSWCFLGKDSGSLQLLSPSVWLEPVCPLAGLVFVLRGVQPPFSRDYRSNQGGIVLVTDNPTVWQVA